MHSTRSSWRLAAVIALASTACAAACSFVEAVVVRTASVFASTFKVGVDIVVRAARAIYQAVPNLASWLHFWPTLAPRVVAMRDYVRRQHRAERPRLMPGWRSVPSV